MAVRSTTELTGIVKGGKCGALGISYDIFPSLVQVTFTGDRTEVLKAFIISLSFPLSQH